MSVKFVHLVVDYILLILNVNFVLDVVLTLELVHSVRLLECVVYVLDSLGILQICPILQELTALHVIFQDVKDVVIMEYVSNVQEKT